MSRTTTLTRGKVQQSRSTSKILNDLQCSHRRINSAGSSRFLEIRSNREDSMSSPPVIFSDEKGSVCLENAPSRGFLRASMPSFARTRVVVHFSSREAPFFRHDGRASSRRLYGKLPYYGDRSVTPFLSDPDLFRRAHEDYAPWELLRERSLTWVAIDRNECAMIGVVVISVVFKQLSHCLNVYSWTMIDN